jgi:hypothetical protein
VVLTCLVEKKKAAEETTNQRNFNALGESHIVSLRYTRIIDHGSTPSVLNGLEDNANSSTRTTSL